MLLFVVADDGTGSTRAVVCDRLPFTLGRDSSSSLTLDAAGVWDSHAEITRDPESGKLQIRSVGDALLLVNSERCESKTLIPGDELQLGGAKLQVQLSPVRQKALGLGEGLVWVLITLITAGQVFLAATLR